MFKKLLLPFNKRDILIENSAFLLLFLYLSALFQPLLPPLQYVLNYEYIAKVLCINKDKPQLDCNGKCYLNEQLREANNPSTDTKQAPTPPVTLNKLLPALIHNTMFRTKVDQNAKTFTAFWISNTIDYQGDVPTPPPKYLLSPI